MLPPHERFDTGDRASLEDDDRLVVEHELLLLDRAAQIGLQLDPLQRHRVHLRRESLVPSLAARLGHVHRHVGVAQQIIRAIAIERRGDPQTGANEYFPAR